MNITFENATVSNMYGRILLHLISFLFKMINDSSENVKKAANEAFLILKASTPNMLFTALREECQRVNKTQNERRRVFKSESNSADRYRRSCSPGAVSPDNIRSSNGYTSDTLHNRTRLIDSSKGPISHGKSIDNLTTPRPRMIRRERGVVLSRSEKRQSNGNTFPFSVFSSPISKHENQFGMRRRNGNVRVVTVQNVKKLPNDGGGTQHRKRSEGSWSSSTVRDGHFPKFGAKELPQVSTLLI